MTSSSVEVAVHLHSALAAAIEQDGRESFLNRLEVSLREYAAQLGIASAPRARIGEEGDRAIVVCAEGAPLPYPPSFLVRLWFGIAPDELRNAADGYLAEHRFPDEWLITCSRHAVASGDKRGCSVVGELAEPEDTFEEVFAQRRADRPEVEISRNLFSLLTESTENDRAIAGVDRMRPEVRQAVEAAYGETVHKLGLRPWLRFVRNDTFDRPEMRVKLNDRTSPPIPLPGPDEVAVTARPTQVRALDFEARPLVDSVTGREQAAAPAWAAERLRDAGLEPVPVVSYIPAAFGRSTAPNAYRMLSVAEVERDLATIEARFPVLVHAALARFSMGEITRLLRALAREQISIRNLRRILGILLAFDAASEEDLERLFLDDRLPDRSEHADPPWARSVDSRLLSFVRTRMRDRVCFDSGIRIDGDTPTRVYETDDAFEHLVDEMLVSRTMEVAEAPLRRIRIGVWHALAADAERRPVLLTATRVRLGLPRANRGRIAGASGPCADRNPAGRQH